MEEKIFESMDEAFSYKYILPLVKILTFYHRHEIYGLENIPKTGRLLIVENHSFASYDGFILGAKVHLHTGRIPYGLADHQLFRFDFIKKYTEKLLIEGTVENAKRVLNAEGLLMLAPGGMKEAIRSEKEKYKIIWENRKGFIKLCLETQTPIIVAACPAADDIYDVSTNKLTNFVYENLKIPFVYPKGVFNGLFPRPIKLVHYLSEPIYPPKIKTSEITPEVVDTFHQKIINQMNQLLKRR